MGYDLNDLDPKNKCSFVKKAQKIPGREGQKSQILDDVFMNAP